MGTFAREIIEHALPILAKLLEDKIRTFAMMLQSLYATNVKVTEKETSALNNIFEDLHWLLLITGHTVGFEGDGETPLIPFELNTFSQKMFTDGRTDINKSIELIAKPSTDIAEIFSDPQQADIILRIIASVHRLTELELTALKCNMAGCLSPELSGTIMWFLKMWLDIYLFPLPEYYEFICEPVKVALGINSDCGKWILNYVLTKVCFNIQHFSGEQAVIDDTVAVFLVILKRKHRCLPVFNSEIFPTLIALKDMNLHVRAKRGLLKGFVQIAASIGDADQRKMYLDQIFVPIAQRYLAIMHKPDLKVTYQNEDIKQAVISILEEVRGCIQGAYNLISSSLFEHFKVIFLELPELLNLYRNYNVIVELILSLLCETVINIDYISGQADASLKTGIYECCISIIRVWIACNSNKISLEVKTFDDCPEDILLVFKLLNCLLSKTLIEDDSKYTTFFFILLMLLNDRHGTKNKILLKFNVKVYMYIFSGEEATIDSGQVVIYGLTNLMPLISMDLIRFPEFCSQYYRTIAMFAETKTHKVSFLKSNYCDRLNNFRAETVHHHPFTYLSIYFKS